MTEIVKPGVLRLTFKLWKRVKLIDMVIFVVSVAIIVALLVTLFAKLSLRHEVSATRPIADQVVKDIATKNARDAWKLSDSKFQAKNSVTQLQALFSAADQIATGHYRVDRQIVSNQSGRDSVYFIYRYSSKPVYYVRAAISRAGGTGSWQLTGLSGSTNESSLIVK